MLVRNFIQNPKQLFLLDGLGALTTAGLLFLVLRPLESYFGMPANVLTWLSGIALCFCMYSISCYLFFRVFQTWRMHLILLANLAYSMLSLALLFRFYSELTALGIVYFCGEIMVILGLVFLEWQAIRKYRA